MLILLPAEIWEGVILFAIIYPFYRFAKWGCREIWRA